MVEQKLPLRTGVGIIVLNNQNKIFVGKRKDNPGNNWQMPQGGVNKNEDFTTAMKRELAEETSIKKNLLKRIDLECISKRFIIKFKIINIIIRNEKNIKNFIDFKFNFYNWM